jgi:hypothetical protein
MKPPFEFLPKVRVKSLSDKHREGIEDVLEVLESDIVLSESKNLSFLHTLWLAEKLKGKKANKDAMKRIEELTFSAVATVERKGKAPVSKARLSPFARGAEWALKGAKRRMETTRELAKETSKLVKEKTYIKTHRKAINNVKEAIGFEVSDADALRFVRLQEKARLEGKSLFWGDRCSGPPEFFSYFKDAGLKDVDLLESACTMFLGVGGIMATVRPLENILRDYRSRAPEYRPDPKSLIKSMISVYNKYGANGIELISYGTEDHGYHIWTHPPSSPDDLDRFVEFVKNKENLEFLGLMRNMVSEMGSIFHSDPISALGLAFPSPEEHEKLTDATICYALLKWDSNFRIIDVISRQIDLLQEVNKEEPHVAELIKRIALRLQWSIINSSKIKIMSNPDALGGDWFDRALWNPSAWIDSGKLGKVRDFLQEANKEKPEIAKKLTQMVESINESFNRLPREKQTQDVLHEILREKVDWNLLVDLYSAYKPELIEVTQEAIHEAIEVLQKSPGRYEKLKTLPATTVESISAVGGRASGIDKGFGIGLMGMLIDKEKSQNKISLFLRGLEFLESHPQMKDLMISSFPKNPKGSYRLLWDLSLVRLINHPTEREFFNKLFEVPAYDELKNKIDGKLAETIEKGDLGKDQDVLSTIHLKLLMKGKATEEDLSSVLKLKTQLMRYQTPKNEVEAALKKDREDKLSASLMGSWSTALEKTIHSIYSESIQEITSVKIEPEELDENLVNAILLYKNITPNRKLLKEILTDYMKGNTRAILSNPKNIDMLNAFKKLGMNTDVWTEGIRREYPIETVADAGEAVKERIKDHIGEAIGIYKQMGLTIDEKQIFEKYEDVKNREDIGESAKLDLLTQLNAIRTLEKGVAALPEGKRTVVVWLERDPLRVMQMGNVVSGSCLGLGRGNEWSTVANAADVNKGVLYAAFGKKDDPDLHEKIFGRKLIAINDSGKLVQFRTYNNELRVNLDKIFSIYTKELAQLANAPLGSSGKVLQVVSERWYDDGIRPFPGAL